MLRLEKGFVKTYGRTSYITQLDEVGTESIDGQTAGEFGLGHPDLSTASGGEKTKYKIAYCLSKESDILLADEPTSNFDIAGIELLQEKLSQHEGLLLIVSHDRELLDRICNKIAETERCGLKLYSGNYTGYKLHKDMRLEKARFEFEQYADKKGNC